MHSARRIVLKREKNNFCGFNLYVGLRSIKVRFYNSITEIINDILNFFGLSLLIYNVFFLYYLCILFFPIKNILYTIF
jgi:hypothetical protein